MNLELRAPAAEAAGHPDDEQRLHVVAPEVEPAPGVEATSTGVWTQLQPLQSARCWLQLSCKRKWLIMALVLKPLQNTRHTWNKRCPSKI